MPPFCLEKNSPDSLHPYTHILKLSVFISYTSIGITEIIKMIFNHFKSLPQSRSELSLFKVVGSTGILTAVPRLWNPLCLPESLWCQSNPYTRPREEPHQSLNQRQWNRYWSHGHKDAGGGGHLLENNQKPCLLLQNWASRPQRVRSSQETRGSLRRAGPSIASIAPVLSVRSPPLPVSLTCYLPHRWRHLNGLWP